MQNNFYEFGFRFGDETPVETEHDKDVDTNDNTTQIFGTQLLSRLDASTEFRLNDNIKKSSKEKLMNFQESSKVFHYEDLKIIEQYAEKEIFYGHLNLKNHSYQLKIVVIRYNMKDIVILNSYW